MKIKCIWCSKTYDVKVTDEELAKFKTGTDLHEIAPHLSADDREIMISQVCGPCFDGIAPRAATRRE